MPIRIKAIEKKMNVGIHKDTYRYQMQPELYSKLKFKVLRTKGEAAEPSASTSEAASR